MQLRPYQHQAVEAVYQHLRQREDNPCVVLPTGSGKTPVIASICRDAVSLWSGRVLVLAHVKELLAQAVDKLHAMAPDLWMQIGVYSAGLGRRDTDHPILVAGIQSVYQKAKELGRFDLVLIDEAHLVPPEGDGMYRRFLEDARQLNPHLRVVGLTATPFRMSSGPICVPPPEGILNAVCYEVGVRELIADGYLCPLRSKAGKHRANTEQLRIRAGEFVAGEVEELMDQDLLVHSACQEIIEHMRSGQRKACLIFASGVQHGQHVAKVIERLSGEECGFVDGDSAGIFRDQIIRRFREGQLRYLANVNVLTTGFDAPNVDCVALLRPTMSPGLYYQMCLDMETEVLTASGWRRCHEVAIGDVVASFDLRTEQIVYAPALDKVHRPLRPGESMYAIQSPMLDIRVTDQHTLVAKSRSRTARHWQLQPACKVARRRGRFMIPIAGQPPEEQAQAELSDAQVAFIGWFLVHGSHGPRNKTIALPALSAPVAAQLEGLLQRCGLAYRRVKGHFVIPLGSNAGKRGWGDLVAWLNRDVPASFNGLSTRQFELLIGAMATASRQQVEDSATWPGTYTICVGCHQRLADRIQQLAVERGFCCELSAFVPPSSLWNLHPQPQWLLRIKRQRRVHIDGTAKRRKGHSPSRYRLLPTPFLPSEWVWCLTTSSGTLVTRRNGKVAIVGNCGRGFRLHPGKADCLVLDFGNNVVRHGPVDQIRVSDPNIKGTGEAPAKQCPQCQALIATGFAVCPDCGFEFPPPDRRKHESTAGDGGVLSGEITTNEYEVRNVHYSVHLKRGASEDTPRSMRVDYEIGYYRYKSEWVCFEHAGYARQKAVAWWRLRSCVPIPATAQEAVELAEAGALAPTFSITVRSVAGEKFDRIIDCTLGAKPAIEEVTIPVAIDDEWDHSEPEAMPDIPEDDIPFAAALA